MRRPCCTGAAIPLPSISNRAPWPEFAAEKALPFAVLRAVTDPAELDLPPAAMVALKDDGSVDLGKVLFAVLKQPKQIPALIALGKDAKAARAALIARVKTLPARTF